MFWFMILLISIFIFIYSFKVGQNNEWDEGVYIAGIIFPVFIVIAIVIATFCTYLTYQHNVEQFKIYDMTLKNKVANIKEIRKAFIDTPPLLGKNNKINNAIAIDMVNKDLTNCLSKAYRNLETYITEINVKYATWQYKYNNRFWTTCYIKPIYDAPLNISDYFKEDEQK